MVAYYVFVISSLSNMWWHANIINLHAKVSFTFVVLLNYVAPFMANGRLLFLIYQLTFEKLII